ncbi:NAD(P)-binding domain-containing protein [Pseudomonas sp. Je.1.5.c]|uniref:NADPH-dependent F420 reductase n=1 Tax=Pseudomonas sp. Je.1.5.c TaxID=3142839 RepID=UPI003DA8113C
MNITLVGTGNMGSAFAKQFSGAGHEVRVTGRDMSKAQRLAAQYQGVTAYPAAEALGDSQIVIVATAFADAVLALKSLGNLDGKIIVDVTNPLTADFMGLTIGHTTSAAEEIAQAFPAAHVVKAFNTIFAQVLADGPAYADDQTANVLIAGDDQPAKLTVKALAQSFGWNTMDAGGVKNARYLEPLAGLNIYFGYGAGMGTQIVPTWLTR